MTAIDRVIPQTFSASNPELQRARGEVRVGITHARGRNRLSDLYQSGCLKAMLPRSHGPVPEAVLINTAGGLTGGDRLNINISVGEQAQLSVATQTAERAYRSTGDAAQVLARFQIGAGAHLDWLAQETILFDGAHLSRRIEADLARGASLLIVEPVVFGRVAMGEVPEQAQFQDHWRLRREGRVAHLEATRLAPPLGDVMGCAAGLDGAVAMATAVLLAQDAPDRLGPMRQCIARHDVRAGASAWGERLVLRALTPEPRAMRALLLDVMTCLRGTAPPRVWTM